MKRLFFAIASLALLLVGCQEEETFRVANEADEVCSFSQITVDLDAFTDTRVHVDNTHKVQWDKNDTIGVYSDMEGVVPFVLESGNTFTSEKGITGKKFYAFYPYSNWPASTDKVTVDNDNVLHIIVPAGNVFSRYEGRDPNPVWTIEKNVIPMVSMSYGNNFSFKHTMGLIHFTVKDVDVLNYVSLSGNNGELLSGPASIDMSSDAPVLKVDDAVRSVWNNTLAQQSFQNKELASGEVVDVYIPVPVGTYSKGFKVEIYGNDKDGNAITVFKKTDKSLTVERASLNNYTELDLYGELAAEQAKERAALIAIYEALNGPNWHNQENWCTDEPIENWYGVSVYNGHVNYLNFWSNNIKGDVPAEIGDLQHLERLEIGDSDITSLPKEIGNLDRVWAISLQNTKITELPDEIGDMRYLYNLTITNTPLKSLPKGLANSLNLNNIYINNTDLESIPAELANMKMGTIALSYNKLTAFPEALINNRTIGSLVINEPNMNGSIPESIGNMTNLYQLSIINTSLSGELPVAIGNLSMLTSLDLSNNNFVGTIPVEFSNLKKLTTLNLSGNLMDGVISKDVLNSDMWANLTTINVNPQRDNHALTFEGGEVFVSEITLDLSEGMVGRESALDLGIHLYPANATSKEIYVEVADEDICRVYDYPNGPRFAGGSKFGETTVTIKVKGSDASATCKIVNMGILYDQTTVHLESGETFTPTITKFGDVDKYKWYWYSNDESVATVNKDGKLTAVGTGETYVRVLIEGVGSFGYNVKVNKQVVESESNQDFTGQQGQWDN